MTSPTGPSGISSRVARGVGANFLGQAVNAIGQLLLVPLFLVYWGRQLYGEWLTLSAAVGYLAIVDFGMQMYVINRLNQLHSVGEWEDYNRTLHSAYFLSLVVSTASFVLLSTVFAIVPVEQWFRFSDTGRATAATVLVLLAAQVAFSIPQGLIAGVYRTIGEYPRGVMIGIAQKGAAILATVATLTAGAGLSVLAAVQIAPMAAAAVYVWFDLRRRHPQVQLGIRRRDTRQALSFLAPSFFFFLIQAAMALVFQGSTLVVGALFGAGQVAVFVTLRTLANALRQGFAAIIHALWPELTALEATKRFETLREIFILSSKAMLLLSVCGSLFLAFEGDDVVRLWTRGGIAYDNRLMAAFLALLLSQTYWLSSSIVMASSNNHRLLSFSYVASSVLGLGLGYLIAVPLGISGVVLGLLAGDLLVCAAFVPLRACRHIGQDYRGYASEVLLRGIPVALVVVGVVYLTTSAFDHVSAMQRLAAVGAATALSGLSMGYLLWFRPAERRRLGALLAEILPAPVGRIFKREAE